MANLHLVTGYGGSDHVTAADDGSLNAAIFGGGQYVLDRGNKLAVSVITSNLVRVLDGDILMQGRHVRLNEGTYVELSIDNGAQAMRRNDLIVCRYTKNTKTGVEECNLVVIKGETSINTATDPAYTVGDILTGGAVQNDFPLYRIPLNGLSVGEPEPLFEFAGVFSNRTIPVSKGGTGSTTASGARNNLGITPANIGAASSNHTHSVNDLNGTLPISKGGTGATTAEGALTNLGACRVYSGHYNGTGIGGSYQNATMIELPFKPALVVIKGTYEQVVILCDELPESNTSFNITREFMYLYPASVGSGNVENNKAYPVALKCRCTTNRSNYTLCFHSDYGAEYQFNKADGYYLFVAIG